MASFSMKFDMGNAAFDGEDCGATEIARILKKVAGLVENGCNGGVIHDVNGNGIGSWGFDASRDEEEEGA